jgi:hypothetical protein
VGFARIPDAEGILANPTTLCQIERCDTNSPNDAN